MKIGINFLLWDLCITEKHYPLFSEMKSIGYDGVEIPLGGGDLKHYQEMRKQIDGAGLECTCTMNGSIEQNIISSDASIRQAGIDHIKWGVENAHALGSSLVGGPFYCAPGVFTGKGPTEDEFIRGVEALSQVCDFAKEAGVKLCVEFLNRFECYFMNTVAQARQFVNAVDHENVGILYDTHHVHYEEKSISEAVNCGGNRIYQVHFSENHRAEPGSGLVDWDENVRALAEINYDGWVVFEAFSCKTPEKQGAFNIWRDQFDAEEQLAADAFKFIQSILSRSNLYEVKG